MKLKSATLKDFKRFTHLTVRGVSETVRLIMLAGPNGCGKSSFFDALYTWHGWSSKKNRSWESDYHEKMGSSFRRRWTSQDVSVEFHVPPLSGEEKKALYFRSAYRNDPEFTIQQLDRTGNLLDETRFARMIDNDAAISRNYRRLASQGLEDLYERGEGSTTFDSYRKESIGEVQTALRRLFPNLELNSLGNPLKDGTFRFTKGTSQGFAYKNLSGGEKAAFDLVLDLVIARRDYDNTVFCIDEPESHMSARLQAELLSVLYDLIPENCQLMLATHSIGMMRRARDIEATNPGRVVFLDFDLDFDAPQSIEPTRPGRTFWKNAYNVALDDLAALIAPRRVVICEGHPKTEKPVDNHSHDARCYERIFEVEFPETRFVSMGNDREIVGDKRGLAEALRLLVGGLEVARLIDRDDRSDDEISDAAANGVRVLSRRNLESYLFDDQVLRALAAAVGKEDKTEELLTKKTSILGAKTGAPPDDLKPASGEIYVECKRILGLPTGYGNDAMKFMRDTLARLIKPGMAVYEELRCDIFGPREES